MLGHIVVGRDALIAPHVRLSEYGAIVDKHIDIINSLKKDLRIDKYVIMPNHLHMIVVVDYPRDGTMKTSCPTNAAIPSVIRSFKSLVTKEIGFSLWQTSYYDHIIRSKADYRRIWKYIDENPATWAQDCYYPK